MNDKQLAAWNEEHMKMLMENPPEEFVMDVADAAAESTTDRLTHDEIFDSLRSKINAR